MDLASVMSSILLLLVVLLVVVDFLAVAFVLLLLKFCQNFEIAVDLAFVHGRSPCGARCFSTRRIR